MSVITFGKHKGTDIKNVPSDYLEWGAEKLESPKWRKEFENELKRRADEDAAERDALKAKIDDPEVFEILKEKAIKEIESEMTASDLEHEYTPWQIMSDAEYRANQELKELKTEVAVENLRKEFVGKEELTLELLGKIEEVHYNYGLERKQFSSQEKYETACEYVRRLEQTRGY